MVVTSPRLRQRWWIRTHLADFGHWKRNHQGPGMGVGVAVCKWGLWTPGKDSQI